jgi:hypothetical protein
VRYPTSATAAEKPLPHRDRESFRKLDVAGSTPVARSPSRSRGVQL